MQPNILLANIINIQKQNDDFPNKTQLENEFTPIKTKVQKKRSHSVTRRIRNKDTLQTEIEKEIYGTSYKNIQGSNYLYQQQNAMLQFQWYQLMKMRKISQEQFNAALRQQNQLLFTAPVLRRQSKKRKSRNCKK